LSIQSPQDRQTLYRLANELNLKLNGLTVSFVHNMNINYTNLCEEVCTFCAFRKNANANDAYVLSLEDILHRIEGHAISEITFQGGLSEKVTFEHVLSLVRGIKENRPEIHLHSFSPEEIRYYAEREGVSFLEILKQVQKAGTDSLCGTAAEILDDEVRKKICPQKVSAQEWVDIMAMAHRMGIPSTATILYGHIEEPRHIVNHFMAIRNLQKSTGMLSEFIPLLFVPDKTPMGKVLRRYGSPYGAWSQDRETSEERKQLALDMLAISRLWFHNTIRNIQTSWVKLGFEGALESLSVGANDMSGTLYSENITREAGGQYGEYTSLDEFQKGIRRIGKIPLERDTLYSHQKAIENLV
jgi:FO synthase subunit 2